MKQKLSCLIISTSSSMYGRDVFLVPYYIGKIFGYEVSYVYHGIKGEDPFINKGVKFIPLSYRGSYEAFSFRGEWDLLIYAFLKAKEIDCLLRFHFSYQTILMAIIYKLRNPKGLFLIKGDGLGLWNSLFRTEAQLPWQRSRNQNSFVVKLKNRLIRGILNIGVYFSDIVTIETMKDYMYLKTQPVFEKYPNKLVRMLNGIDEEAINKYGIKDLPFEEKENWIILVGRHGSYEKNTQMSLRALENIDLKDWHVFYIGPVSEEFDSVIRDFCDRNPQWTDKVHFVGAIYDQARLWSYFNKAKVFVHTSLIESYGIVLAEAYRFGDYILSTDVGVASEFINYGYGSIVKQDDSNELRDKLNQIIRGDIDLSVLYHETHREPLSWESEIRKLSSYITDRKYKSDII